MDIVVEILDLLTKFSVPQLILVGVLGYFVAPRLLKKEINEEKLNCMVSNMIQKDKEREAIIRDYIVEILKDVYVASSNRARIILLRAMVDNFEEQYNAFTYRLKDNLDVVVYRMIINAVRYNHFKDKMGDDYDRYLDEKTDIILNASRLNLDSFIDLYPDLKDTNEERWSRDETKRMLRNIFDYVKRMT